SGRDRRRGAGRPHAQADRGDRRDPHAGGRAADDAQRGARRQPDPAPEGRPLPVARHALGVQHRGAPHRGASGPALERSHGARAPPARGEDRHGERGARSRQKVLQGPLRSVNAPVAARFYCPFLGPVVLLAATAVTLTALGLLSEVLAPAARALSLPRWTATVFAVLARGGGADAEGGVWRSVARVAVADVGRG